MRKHHLITAIFIAIALAACSMSYIENVPDWMHGTWDMFTEDGEYIGRCEIDEYSIEVTAYSWGNHRIDILNDAMQNGGKTESNIDSYSIYYGSTNASYYKFNRIDNASIKMARSDNHSLEEIFILLIN